MYFLKYYILGNVPQNSTLLGYIFLVLPYFLSLIPKGTRISNDENYQEITLFLLLTHRSFSSFISLKTKWK